jgi:RimJ/RimL family protein N-acetyltransferase
VAEVTIRPAIEDDIDAMLDVVTSVAAEGRWIATEVPFDRVGRAGNIRAALANAKQCASFVAEVDGKVVGSINLELAPYGVVGFGVALIDGYRGQGIGSRLLDRGIAWAASAGAHKITLEVWPHNQGAIALYRRAGFVEEGRLIQHYRRRNGEHWDALVMSLLLAVGTTP